MFAKLTELTSADRCTVQLFLAQAADAICATARWRKDSFANVSHNMHIAKLVARFNAMICDHVKQLDKRTKH